MQHEDIRDQAERFVAYHCKPGALDFDTWARTKDFPPSDREKIRVEVARLQSGEDPQAPGKP